MAETTQDLLLMALKQARSVVAACAEDVAGTPTEASFWSEVRNYDAVIAKAEGSAALARTDMDAAEADRERLDQLIAHEDVEIILWTVDRSGMNPKSISLKSREAIDAARLADRVEGK